ncbi:MAG: hypothetical protein SV253_08800 [Halobacteria archaeon]|nr:hypothetical protein [Halobacteria archaeon]
MTDLVGSEKRISDEDILVRLLQMGVVIEEYAEEKSAVISGRAAQNDYIQEILLEALDESQTHRDTLIDLIDDLRADGTRMDARHIEELVREKVERSEIDAETDEQALREQLRSERLAYSFYDTLIDACENTKTSDSEAETEIDTDADTGVGGCLEMNDDKIQMVVSTLKEIREDEKEDAQKIENILKGVA